MKCSESILSRALKEYQESSVPELKKTKLLAISILLQHGWKSVFKESLVPYTTGNVRFKSHEEHGRFGFCEP
jgi:hypothetical protein